MFFLFFFVFVSCNIEAGALGRHERVFCDVVRARGTWLFVFLAVRSLSCLPWFVCVCFFLATSKRLRQADMRVLSTRNEGGGQ